MRQRKHGSQHVGFFSFFCLNFFILNVNNLSERKWCQEMNTAKMIISKWSKNFEQ